MHPKVSHTWTEFEIIDVISMYPLEPEALALLNEELPQNYR